MFILTMFLLTANLIITGMLISSISIAISEGRTVTTPMYVYATFNFIMGIYQLIDIAYKG